MKGSLLEYSNALQTYEATMKQGNKPARDYIRQLTHLSDEEPMQRNELLSFLNHGAPGKSRDMSDEALETLADKMACGSQLLRAWLLYNTLFTKDYKTFKELATRMGRRGVLGSVHEPQEVLARAVTLSTWYGRLTKDYAAKLFGFIETQDIRSFESHMTATSLWDKTSVRSFLNAPKGEGPRALALTVVASSRDQSSGRVNERVRTYLQSISAACPAIALKVSKKNYLVPCRDIPEVAVHVASVICGRLRLTHLCKLCRALHCLRFLARG